MAYENIQIDHGNFAIGRSGTFFTMDHVNNQLIEKNNAGAVIFSYFLDQDITEVSSLKFDGYYFWSLERQGSTGFRIRKWEIGTDDLVRRVAEMSYASDGVNSYNCHALAVEYYSDTLTSAPLVGATSITVQDGSVVQVGDSILIGPSTAIGYEGSYNTVSVIGKVGTTLTVSPALSADFQPGAAIYFTRNFLVFSDTATGGMSGALYKYRSRDGVLLTVDVGNQYNKVRGAVFFKNHIMFVRAGEVIWLDPDSYNITKSQAIDNLTASRGEHIECSDLAGYSNTLYRLEQEHVYYDTNTSSYLSENWSPQFNYNTSSVVPEVYFVSVKAEPPIVHKSAAGVSLSDMQSDITVEVLDQFRTPIFNRLVSFASTGGSVSPISGTTDLEGKVYTTYTADTSTGEVTLTATVT